MNWTELTTEDQLKNLVEKSLDKPQVIFKHSTRCSISSVIKKRLETGKANEDIDFHYLDLLTHRSLSNKIADDLNVYHESPQVLLIQNGKCIFDESNLVIRMQDILSEVV
jgi:bacillithiol system protein YtxJ